jgi:hypothetical protein
MVTLEELLTLVHQRYRPRNYVEVGVRNGRSLALSRVRTIAIDPEFAITAPLECDLRLVKTTSDEYFARPDAIARFPEGAVDLSFIDGMHLFDFALRDFINLERLSAWTSVIVLDDMLPRTVAEAARERHTKGWTGDVFRVVEVLRKYRPDLIVVVLDISPTGAALVFGADPTSTTLKDRYDEIVAAHAMPDPQSVSEEFLRRSIATEPWSVLESAIWSTLIEARRAGTDRETGLPELRRILEAAARPAAVRALPPSKPAAKKSVGPVVQLSVTALRRRLRPLRRAVRNLRGRSS